MKNMKKSTMISVVVMLIFAVALTSVTAVVNQTKSSAVEDDVAPAPKTAKLKKPGQVKGLKKVKISTKYYKKEKGKLNCQAICSAKIKFNKVKEATGYQVLVYNTLKTGDLTPLVFEYNTKKTTYTIKNLVPQMRYTIKVKAYTKGKDGKVVYGKEKSLKIKTSGEKRGCYFVCNACGACMPGNDNLMAKHIREVGKLHKELHAGWTYYVK